MVIQLSTHILIPKRYQKARSMLFWHQGEWDGVSKADSLKQWLFLAVLSLWTTRQKPVGEHDGSCVLFYTCLIKMTLVGEKGKNVRLWHQLQTTVWDKSVIPCENCSHLSLWIASRLTDSNSGWWSRIKGQSLAPVQKPIKQGQTGPGKG